MKKANKEKYFPNLGQTTEVIYSEKNQEQVKPELLKVEHVAKILGCSTRTVWRLADLGKMPSPVHIGRLVRWQYEVMKKWIASGCPEVRKIRV